MNKQELEAYVRGLCKDKGYDETKTERAVAKAIERADDEDEVLLNGVLELPIKGTADYNKHVDELKAKATTLDNWHKTAQATVTASEQKARDAEAKVAKYREQVGEIDDEGEPAPKPGEVQRDKAGKFVKREEIQSVNVARDQYLFGTIAELGDIRARHAKMFKGEIISDREILNEMGKAAADQTIPEEQRRITASQAYERLYGEKVAQHNEAETKAGEQRLRDEGAKAERERMSRQGLRSGAVVGESTVTDILNRKKDDPRDKLTDEDRISALATDMESEFAKQEARYAGDGAGGST